MKKFSRDLVCSLLALFLVLTILILFAIAMALGPESTQEKLQRERWEQSPHGG